MNNIFKFSVYLCLIFCFSIIFTACGRKNEVPSQSNKQAMIEDVNYSSLTEAVDNAKTGDTIKVYDDLKDNKNVTITKPVTIEGVLTNSQIKPKFYGSITINMSGTDDTATIENIEIVHGGEESDGLNNDTRIGINLIDGGLTLKSNIIGLSETSTENQENASGLIVSRKVDSKNTQPIVIKGNRFEIYKTGDQLSSAIIIKSDKEGEYKQITLNENEIYNQNTFSNQEAGNQLVSINYSSNPITYPFFSTTSADDLTKALLYHQSPFGSRFLFFPTAPLSKVSEEPINIDNKTNLEVDGNKSADMAGAEFKVDGSVLINGNMKNVTFEKVSDTANIMFGEGVDQSGVTIK